jgi:hypothetical protein
MELEPFPPGFVFIADGHLPAPNPMPVISSRLQRRLFLVITAGRCPLEAHLDGTETPLYGMPSYIFEDALHGNLHRRRL